MEIGIKRHSQNAKIPDQTFAEDAGFDVYSTQKVIIQPGKWSSVRTGLSLNIPPGAHAEVRPRSGLALKHGVAVLNAPGTIDAGYSGEVRVILINHGLKPYIIEAGEGIAQLVFVTNIQASFIESDGSENSDRGELGFGSG